jgi:ubiquinone/menaquinone biosynthesis C-methylase UbiE
MDQQATTEHAATRAFEQWLRVTHGPAHARRTAARNAAFFLPHLRPGMRLLDAGCGPGSITLGLAEAVAPGEAAGIDASAERVAAASALAAERGVTNVRFEVADVCALPYSDASFDAAFVHAVLQHLPEPLAALVELRRVLRPGGVIGVADADFDGAIMAPASAAIERSTELLGRMRLNAYIGKHLAQLLHAAGFARTAASASVGYEGTPEATRMAAGFQARYLEAPEFVAHVVARGWASEAELREMAAAWRAWGDAPGAFAARFTCEAVGWV